MTRLGIPRFQEGIVLRAPVRLRLFLLFTITNLAGDTQTAEFPY
jgi:hypothetical protein